jgi:alkylhydroperoxidase/carboxymuconolactone decarboxylase family protein YurZ
MAVPPELEALQDAIPGLIVGLRDARVAGEKAGVLSEREIELVRLGTLVALGAPDASFRAHVARAVAVGASSADVWSSVGAIATLVGVPSLLHAAPLIAAALDGEPA